MGRKPLFAFAVAVLALALAAQAQAKAKPDLVVKALSAPPTNVAQGGSFTMFDTTKNVGKKTASKSTTAYFLSTNAAFDAADLKIGSHRVGPLKPRKSSAGSARLTIPSVTAAGIYNLIACADSARKVKESKEKNNCKAAAAKVTVGNPSTTTPTTTTPTTPTPTTTPPSADLSVGITNGAAREGDPLVFTVTVANAGPNAADNVSLTDALPAGLTFTSANASAGGCSQSSGTVTCTLGQIAAGAGATVTITLSGPTNTSAQTFTDSATVSSTTGDPSSANNSAHDDANVEGADHAVGTAAQAITRTDNCSDAQGRKCESLDGDVVADAMRAKAGTEFALVDAGGIRADLTCAVSSGVAGCPTSNYAPPPYDIVRGSIFNTLPFGDKIAKFALTGTELWAYLEHMVSSEPNSSTNFGQVSGLCVAYDAAQPAGSRVTDVFVAGASGCTATAVAKDSTNHTIAVTDFVAGGGDGYPNYASRATYLGTAADAVEDYLNGQADFAVSIQGRINCTASGCP